MSADSSTSRKRKLALPLLLSGAFASIVLALSLSPSVAAFTASIANTNDTAGTGTLVMQEVSSDGKTICNSSDSASNAASCATINKYGGNLNMVPGQTVTTSITIKNTGSVPANSFSLTPGACAQSNNGTLNGSAKDLCAKLSVVVTSGSTTIYSGPLSGFTTQVDLLNKLGTTSVAAGASVPFSFAVTLASSADSTYAGLQASQPLTWTFNS